MKWTAAVVAEVALGTGIGTGREYIVYFMLIFTRIQNDFPIVEKYCAVRSLH